MGCSGLHQIQETFLLTPIVVVYTRTTSETSNRHFKGLQLDKGINLHTIGLCCPNTLWTKKTTVFIPKCYFLNWFICFFFFSLNKASWYLSFRQANFRFKFWSEFENCSNTKGCQQDGWVCLKLESEPQTVKNHQIRVNPSQIVVIDCTCHISVTLSHIAADYLVSIEVETLFSPWRE